VIVPDTKLAVLELNKGRSTPAQAEPAVIEYGALFPVTTKAPVPKAASSAVVMLLARVVVFALYAIAPVVIDPRPTLVASIERVNVPEVAPIVKC